MAAKAFAKLDRREGSEHHLLDPTAQHLHRLHLSQWWTYILESSGVYPDTADCFAVSRLALLA